MAQLMEIFFRLISVALALPAPTCGAGTRWGRRGTGARAGSALCVEFVPFLTLPRAPPAHAGEGGMGGCLQPAAGTGLDHNLTLK